MIFCLPKAALFLAPLVLILSADIEKYNNEHEEKSLIDQRLKISLAMIK